MCGRTAVSLGADRIRRACAYRDTQGRRRHPEWKNADQYKPSYNKSPQSNNPVLLSLKHFEKDAGSSERILMAMRWGLVPTWFKESDPSKMQYNTSNCRSDTMMQKLSYKGPLVKGKRCVVLAEGYYEWQQRNGQKQPYFIYFPLNEQETIIKSDVEEEDIKEDRRLLTMAGIFDCWEPPNGGETLYSYTVITVDASKTVSSIHNRMPAILDGDDAISKWLDFAEIPIQEALKVIHPTENLAFHPVSTVVNNSRNSSPVCIVPIDLDVKKETKVSASSKMMLNWLKNKSPKKEEEKEGDLPRWSSQFIQTAPAKRTSSSFMDQWLKKEDEGPSPKQSKFL
uniref:Abasic site processing protein HMCES n=1 Tax=Anolis carolinensis TaxID=28377 RepID=G1KEX9_ANOCA|nr:PREDICTED: embryonic stem cell-specific 5-hydroxymethylcytosine-binding protein [Anolis carolinensis]|eukprot:XP_016847126.1 PREDICTED: embryonic stem cell-specific 5-hydroxymethylcytosine-binding protein [Anolis carolinensis]